MMRRIARGLLLATLWVAAHQGAWGGAAGRFDGEAFQAVRAGKRTITAGHRGSEVVVLQQALRDMGFAIDRCDGAFGMETREAVRAYQAHVDLPATGELDAATLSALEREAPPAGLALWQMPNPPGIPVPWVIVQGERRPVRVVVVTSERRTFLFSVDGTLVRVMPNAVGSLETPTVPGLRIIAGKLDERAARAVGRYSRWKDARAFGVRLIDLREKDPVTGMESDVPQELHGTYDRRSIGTRASHGCMRHRNEDIQAIYEEVQVGDLVWITPEWTTRHIPGLVARR